MKKSTKELIFITLSYVMLSFIFFSPRFIGIGSLDSALSIGIFDVSFYEFIIQHSSIIIGCYFIITVIYLLIIVMTLKKKS